MRAILVSACLLVRLLPAAAAEDPLFADSQVLALRVVAPLEQLMDERSGEDLPGTVHWQAADGSERTLEAGIRTRGKFRGDPKNCSFAPLRLNFRKSAVKGTLFDGQDKLKLVTHCRSKSARYQQGVVREYLAYRMFNTLTPMSFRARLLDVTYVDAASPADEQRAYAFLIEDDDSLAARAGMERAEIPATTLETLDPGFLNLVSMFEYFLGNTDFSPITGPPGETCCHNTVLLREPAGVLYPVPYDFDMSGMVDAPYARPHPRLHIDDVKTRVYRGRCRNNDRLPATIDAFMNARAGIEQLLQDTPELSGKTRRDMSRYVQSFYSTIEDETRVRKLFVESCIS